MAYDQYDPRNIRDVISSDIVARMLADARRDESGGRLTVEEIRSRMAAGCDEKASKTITSALHLMYLFREADYMVDDQGEQVWWLRTAGPEPRRVSNRRSLGR